MGIASANSRRATVYVGETCRDVLEGVAPAAGALLETPCSFSFADPPIAVGEEGVVLLCEAHQPRPIAPPMSCVGSAISCQGSRSRRTINRASPTNQTQRARRVVPFCVFRSQALLRGKSRTGAVKRLYVPLVVRLRVLLLRNHTESSPEVVASLTAPGKECLLLLATQDGLAARELDIA